MRTNRSRTETRGVSSALMPLSRTNDLSLSIDGLTPRQLQVPKLIADGRTTKQIALDLNISVKTVESHRAQLMERLGIHDVAGLVRVAIKGGLIN